MKHPSLRRRAAALAASISLAAPVPLSGCAPLGAGAESVRLPLDPDRPGLVRVGALEFRGALALSSPIEAFGGLSGLDVSADGRALVAVSDRGAVVTARLDYGPGGELSAARDIAARPLPDRDGRPVRGSRADAEGLARLPDGRWAVAFERRHRVQLYAADPGGPAGRGTALLGLEGLETASSNGGVEALAALPDGRLLAIEEGEDDAGGAHRAWLGGEGSWKRLTYVARDPFRPTDAAVMPGGDLLVLERRASILGGFGARVTRVRAADVRPGAVLRGEELAVIESPLTVDNFEGIATAPAPGGGLNIYLLSDDNFFPLQRTILAMFRLDDPY
jgi:hypothetical protein